METVDKEKAALISGIEADAHAEEEKIIKEAEVQAAEKKQHSEKKIESLLNEAHEKAKKQSETAKNKIISAAEREVKRCSMRARDAIVQDIMDRVEKKLSPMTGDENYRSVLVNWIAEAAIGLGAESARINASEEERALIDDHMLSEIARGIQKQTGKQTSLTLSDAKPLLSQGIVLTAADGRTAFNNQVRTRMLRKQREIRTLIYNTLFNYDQKE
jgi:V/A-type H+-transporting ATPase subunit E